MRRVDRLWTAPEGSAPMDARESVWCLADRGIADDRYCLGTGYYSPDDVCQVTFVAGEALDEIRERFDIDLTDGRHRRNVELRGVDVHDLLGQRFRVGEATFEGTRPRPPCAHVERVAAEEGVARALREGRGGICAAVVDGGDLAVDDELMVLGPVFDGEGLVEAIRDRHD
ncbi:MOSC domain-containing protein [Halomarina oriensis]|uniref:MOSC domain-containing protein n=1 Tax=Halomarina oriensis TaxID=671145 RepID=A0A6B0GGE7_9EURY|nr:MOSC domain-containing protein [Halomarina oriensis]MWG33892.1 MOSC domain-containing protein [Halomarina oriensis]